MEIDPRLVDDADKHDAQLHQAQQPLQPDHRQQQQHAQQHHQLQQHHQQQQHQQQPANLDSLASQAHQLPQLYHNAYAAAPQAAYPQQPLTPQQLGQPIQYGATPAGNNNQHQPQQSNALLQSGATPEDTKRPRACEACRGLKVKCEFEPQNHDGPCKRCTKAHRQCIVTQPSRKRQKKTDSRVAELEKKLNALSEVLQRSQAAGQDGGDLGAEVDGTGKLQHPYEQMASYAYGTHYPARPESNMGSSSPWPSAADAQQQYSYVNDMAGNAAQRPNANKVEQSPLAKPSVIVTGQKRKHQDDSMPLKAEDAPLAAYPKSGALNEYADVIDRGLLTADLAGTLFDRYVQDMAPHMPSVVFPSGTTSTDVRKSKPILFLAILAVGASTDHPTLATQLTKEVMQTYAERVINRGEKSLELIQAMLVSTIWYWPPEHFEEVKFYQLIHLAAVMAIDIGLHKKSKPGSASSQKSMAGLWNWRRAGSTDSSSIEARRTWITCYFLCCNSATGLRRPNLVHWSPYIGECVEILETSPLAMHSDKTLCQWVKSQRIMELISTQFDMHDDHMSVNIGDPNVQSAVEGFEGMLEKWSAEVPKDVLSPLLKMSEHIVSLYIHEIAMNFESTKDGTATPGNGQASILTEAHISALSTCLTSIDTIFETWLAMDINVIRALPVMHVVRIAYAVVVLIKMYFAATTPGSELGKVIDPDNMKVEQYLDALLQKYKEITSEEKSRSGSKFLMVLVMLRTCLHRQKAASASGKSGPGSNAEGATQQQDEASALKPDQQTQGQKQDYNSTNTPLQLLSEVATGTASNSGTPNVDPRFEARTPQMPWVNVDATQQKGSVAQNAQSNAGNASYAIDPALNQPPQAISSQGIGNGGLEYDPNNFGNGLEQAIGMAMGEGDLSGWFGDEAYQAFLKAMADGNGMNGGFEDYAFL